jgi:hypothetical protein
LLTSLSGFSLQIGTSVDWGEKLHGLSKKLTGPSHPQTIPLLRFFALFSMPLELEANKPFSIDDPAAFCFSKMKRSRAYGTL